MQYELQAMDVDVNFVIVNRTAPDPQIEALTNRCNFPVFQDVQAVNAWGMMDGQKDDFYFYDREGILRAFTDATEDIALTSYDDPPEEPTSGYTRIKQMVLDLVESDGETALERSE